MNNYIIAIDPDVDNSGVAYLNRETKQIELSNKRFPDLIKYVIDQNSSVQSKGENLTVVVEAGWLNAISNYHGVYGRKGMRISKNVGANHEIGKLIVEMLQYHNIDVVELKPLKKCWKGKDGKITHEEISQFIPSMPKKSNQEARDSALIAWVYANFPIRMKI